MLLTNPISTAGGYLRATPCPRNSYLFQLHPTRGRNRLPAAGQKGGSKVRPGGHVSDSLYTRARRLAPPQGHQVQRCQLPDNPVMHEALKLLVH
jgi:hypothetical protein